MSDLPLPDPASQDALEGVLDIQHDTDPAQDHGPARHIPHIGHALLFFALTIMSIALCEGAVGSALHITTQDEVAHHPMAGFVGECVAYAVSLSVSWFLFRSLWKRSFPLGIGWTGRAARRYAWQLVLLGVALSTLAQGSEYLLQYFFHTTDQTDVMLLLHSRLSAWVLTLLGPTLAPLMEEVAFRGFLLPALATAYDYLSLNRTPAAIAHWQRSTAKTPAALVFGSVMSSIAFALVHGSQLHWANGPVMVLFLTSMAFSAVYIRFRSVAASTLVHVAYNSLIFFELLVQSGAYRHLDKIT